MTRPTLSDAATIILLRAMLASAETDARRYRLCWLSARRDRDNVAGWRGSAAAANRCAADLVAERNRARATAVRLEQELAQVREQIAQDLEQRASDASYTNAEDVVDIYLDAARVARGGA